MCSYSEFSPMFKSFCNAKTELEKEQISESFVKKLCNNGLTDEKIIITAHRLIDEEIKIAQGNCEMIKNGKKFNELVKKAIDKKNRYKNKYPKKHPENNRRKK